MKTCYFFKSWCAVAVVLNVLVGSSGYAPVPVELCVCTAVLSNIPPTTKNRTDKGIGIVAIVCRQNIVPVISLL